MTMNKTWWQAAGVSAFTFVVYVIGACRSIYVGDSGELVTAVATLGIPHPSGYPLYVLLGKLWTLLVPVGTVAFRMSLFSAFFGSLAAGLLFVVARRSGASALPSLVGAGTLAFVPSFWSQATIQRVYTLNGFFVVAVIGCALEWFRQQQRADPTHDGAFRKSSGPIRWMVFAAFLSGLGACNHTVMGVVGLAVGVFAILSHPSLLSRPKQILACIVAGIAGLLPYLYLPLRSSQDPRLDWGNPETFESFKATVLRQDFWHRAWMESPQDWVPIVFDFLHAMASESFWVGALLVGFSLFSAWTRQTWYAPMTGRGTWPVLLPLLVAIANLIVVGMHGSRADIFIWHRYYVPALVALSLLIAWGSHELQSRIRRWPSLRPAILLLPVAQLLTGWNQFDRSDFLVAEDYSRQLLADVPPGSHLSASDDNILFVLMYLHLVEGVRPDINLVMQGVGGAELENIRFNPDHDSMLFTHHPNWNIAGLEVVPRGLAFQIVRTGTVLPAVPTVLSKELSGADDPKIPKDYLTRNLIGQYHYMRGLNYEKEAWPRAYQEFQLAEAASPENDVMFYNLGLIYERNGMFRRSLRAFERAAEINPRHIPSEERVRASDRVAESRAKVDQLSELERQLGFDVAKDRGPSDEILPPETHLALAAALETRGEGAAARGHRLMAQER